jgi:hypothetical protein
MTVGGGVELFLSYKTYYTVGLLWGLFLKHFPAPVFVLGFIWHHAIYRTLVGTVRASDPEFNYYLPLTLTLGVAIGYSISSMLKLRRLVFMKRIDVYLKSVALALLMALTFHATCGIWESTSFFQNPVNYLVTGLMDVMLVTIWSFLMRGQNVWGYRDPTTGATKYSDAACQKFFVILGLFLLSADLVFAALEWSFPGLKTFLVAIIVFTIHLVMHALISTVHKEHLSDPPHKIVRNAFIQAWDEMNPSGGGWLDFRVFSDKDRNGGRNSMEMEDMERGVEPPPPPQNERKSKNKNKSSSSTAGYAIGSPQASIQEPISTRSNPNPLFKN